MCISDIRCKMENHLGDSFDMNLSLCAVKIGPLKGEELLFLSFWTNFRKKMRSSYKYFVSFSNFAIQLGI